MTNTSSLAIQRYIVRKNTMCPFFLTSADVIPQNCDWSAIVLATGN